MPQDSPGSPPQRAFVGVYPVNARGEILLQLRDDRPGLGNPGTWTTLGGMVEPDETPDEAMRRELQEECGRVPESLILFQTSQRPGRPGEFVRVASYTAAVDWTLDDLILGEGQAFAWLAYNTLADLPLNPIIREEILDFAASPLRAETAALAPPFRAALDSSVHDVLIEAMSVEPHQLVVLAGATASFAARLRERLPPGARLTASPAVHERPDAVICWPRRVGPDHDLSRLTEAPAPSGSLWLAGTTEAHNELMGQGSALGLSYHESRGWGEGQVAVRFTRATSGK